MPQDARLEFHGQRTRTPRTHNRARRMLKLKRREHRSQRGTRGTDPRATQAPRIRHYAARWRSIKALRRSAPESRSCAKKNPRCALRCLTDDCFHQRPQRCAVMVRLELEGITQTRGGRHHHDARTSVFPPSSRYCSRPIPHTRPRTPRLSPAASRTKRNRERPATRLPSKSNPAPTPSPLSSPTLPHAVLGPQLLALAPLLLPLLLTVSSCPYPPSSPSVRILAFPIPIPVIVIR
ncbi:hypothetical protein B0H13DRAFT_2155705 [Mycena leptocephala]|nr:hypothetical protein B0H13DRAFT_2155705 [Mycena leptocephala]